MFTPSRSAWLAIAFGFTVATLASPARAQFDRPTVNDAGLVVQVFSYTPARGMDWGTGGDWGTDMYVSSGNEIKRIDAAGTATTFATGFTTPTGVKFSPGGAYGDFLYVLENNGAVKRVDPTGAVSNFATIPNDPNDGSLPALNDLAFGNGSGGFSTDLFVTDGSLPGSAPGQIYQVTSAGAVSQFFSDFGMTSAGITFANSAAFANNPMIVAESANFGFDDGGVRAFAANSTFSVVLSAPASNLFDPSDVTEGPGSANFGADLFVTDFATDKLYTLTAGGTLTDFATGFSFQVWYDADLLFSLDGSALYITDLGAEHCEGFGLIYRIGLPGTFVEPECGVPGDDDDDTPGGEIPAPAALPAGLALLAALGMRRRR